jgi:hypothetical protein
MILPSKYFLEFREKFPNSQSVQMWENNLKAEIYEFGNFGNALFDGNIQDAFVLADSQNKKYLKKMEFNNSGSLIA